MNIYRTYAIDPETGYQMVLDNVNYNNACFWLDRQGYEVNDTVVRREDGMITDLYGAFPEESNEERHFIVDERRDFLMLDDSDYTPFWMED